MYFDVKTPERIVRVGVFFKFVEKNDVKTNKTFFAKLCEKCKNYNLKYSCPPKSPSFESLCKHRGLVIVLFKCCLSNIDSTEFNKVRIANSVMKSRIEKLMKHLEGVFNSKYFGSGSCRLCKKCSLQENLPCRHPGLMHFSLEATGVDCNYLSSLLFNIPLLWYKDNKAPEYTCTISGLPCKLEDAEIVEKEIAAFIQNLNSC
ncbi:Uncharacterised protein [Candidatus Tiddalikarchaeum anstoanum]|nr:Uncharacterised protein [Candidatus Tiddalikarchaeum anstoanum]